ncbi:type II toxin-antitoxin system HicA family toxin [bacterium]|nr:type II toxin-antitoxin system HicA family toxin [bacterium]MBU1937402.1 type II toxin-antitoxin system HicA family toxin [bacterium]
MSAAKLRVVSAKELISILERLGFQRRAYGATSHVRYIHPDGRRTTIPIHKGHDIGRGLLRKILRDIELSPDEFSELL